MYVWCMKMYIWNRLLCKYTNRVAMGRNISHKWWFHSLINEAGRKTLFYVFKQGTKFFKELSKVKRKWLAPGQSRGCTFYYILVYILRNSNKILGCVQKLITLQGKKKNGQHSLEGHGDQVTLKYDSLSLHVYIHTWVLAYSHGKIFMSSKFSCENISHRKVCENTRIGTWHGWSSPFLLDVNIKIK